MVVGWIGTALLALATRLKHCSQLRRQQSPDEQPYNFNVSAKGL